MRTSDRLAAFAVDDPAVWRWRFLFFQKVAIDNGCWLWLGVLDQDGYGKFSVSLPGLNKQVQMPASRFAFFVANGRWPQPMALHSCDNRRCVNAAHLEEGDQRKNIGDAVRRGRHKSNWPRGEMHTKARMSAAFVVRLRERYRSGERICDIIKSLDLEPGDFSASSIRQAIVGATWKELP